MYFGASVIDLHPTPIWVRDSCDPSPFSFDVHSSSFSPCLRNTRFGCFPSRAPTPAGSLMGQPPHSWRLLSGGTFSTHPLFFVAPSTREASNTPHLEDHGRTNFLTFTPFLREGRSGGLPPFDPCCGGRAQRRDPQNTLNVKRPRPLSTSVRLPRLLGRQRCFPQSTFGPWDPFIFTSVYRGKCLATLPGLSQRRHLFYHPADYVANPRNHRTLSSGISDLDRFHLTNAPLFLGDRVRRFSLDDSHEG